MKKPLRHFDYIKAWLTYTLGAAILGALIGFILGIFLAAAHVPLSQGKIIIAIVALAFGIPFSYFMFRLAVNRPAAVRARGPSSQTTSLSTWRYTALIKLSAS